MQHHQTIEAFYKLTHTEEYFEFFDLEYDKQLINVKRFHILKEYGNLIKMAFEQFKGDETRLLDFLKFSLLRVYGDYKNGYAPSAADVWNMFAHGKLGGCMSCTPTQGNHCGC